MAEVSIDIAKEQSVQQVGTVSGEIKAKVAEIEKALQGVKDLIGVQGDREDDTLFGAIDASKSAGASQKPIFYPPIVKEQIKDFTQYDVTNGHQEVFTAEGEGCLFRFSSMNLQQIRIYIDGEKVIDIRNAAAKFDLEIGVGLSGGGDEARCIKPLPMPVDMVSDDEVESRLLIAPIYFKENLLISVNKAQLTYKSQAAVSYGLF